MRLVWAINVKNKAQWNYVYPCVCVYNTDTQIFDMDIVQAENEAWKYRYQNVNSDTSQEGQGQGNYTFYCIKIFTVWNFFFFLGPQLQHTEVPRLQGELELKLLVYVTATAMWDPSHICNLYQSSRQCWILSPLSKARDRIYILMDTSWVCNPLSHNRNSHSFILSFTTNICWAPA